MGGGVSSKACFHLGMIISDTVVAEVWWFTNTKALEGIAEEDCVNIKAMFAETDTANPAL